MDIHIFINFLFRSAETAPQEEGLANCSVNLSENNSDSSQFAQNIIDNLEARNSIETNCLSTKTHESSIIEDTKRTHAKQLIERYFFQLSVGCGNSNCGNENCASNKNFEKLTANQAAARAIRLFSEESHFCDTMDSIADQSKQQDSCNTSTKR